MAQTDVTVEVGDAALLARADFQTLIDALKAAGYAVIGPIARDGAVAYDEIDGADELPAGRTDVQDGGHYRLADRDDAALFGYTSGVQSWRRQLSPPRHLLWRANRTDDGFEVAAPEPAAPRQAFLGMRACELVGVAIQDKVFVHGEHVEPHYAARRASALFIAVHCTRAGDTCFCTSMDTGPRAETGFDLALTELIENGRHEFLIEIGSAAGAEIARGLPLRPAAESDLTASRDLTSRAAAEMGRALDTDGLKERLQAGLEDPRWDDVAQRCLSCANCTMVCPTCFCSTTEDVTDITGDVAERHMRWDLCFTLDHSYLHGDGAVHAETRSQYRQWLTHKLANWIDQFGTSGCVGCGRCITWCPVGIDITVEAAAIGRGEGSETHGGD